MIKFKQNSVHDETDKILWDMWMTAYYLPIVTVGDEIGYFKILDKENIEIYQISKELNISLRGAEILTNTLASLGLVQKINSLVSLSPLYRKFLLSNSVFYWGNQLEGFRERIEHKKIINALKNSSPQLKFTDDTFTNMWEQGSITYDAANDFTKKMQATHLCISTLLDKIRNI